jgi:cytochrome P450
MRYIRQDTDIAGTTVAAGTLIFVLLAAANRDPAQFREPETFDIARTLNDHLAFGEGIHFCIGAPLARMEGAIAIGSLLARYKRIRPAAPEASVAYKGSFFLRGLASLPLEAS